jgi:hypothetical protein
MADVRVNGRRLTVLQKETNLQRLVEKLEALADRNKSCLTSLAVEGKNIELDLLEQLSPAQLQLKGHEIVEAKVENTAQLSFESLQVAQEMAELLVFDIKVATLKMWDSNHVPERELEILLKDCHAFLTLGAHPLDLLQRSPFELSAGAQDCLRELDRIAQSVEDATLLAINAQTKDACHVLVGRVMPSVERWLGLTAGFAQELEIDRIQKPDLGEGAEVMPFRPLVGQRNILVTR